MNTFSTQQAELEEALQPLEASLSASGQTVDSERERTYALAERLDGQLARMCGDLKEVAWCWTLETLEKEWNGVDFLNFTDPLTKVIEHLNSTARSQDSRDPVHQIGKVKIPNTF